ncbi:UDP-N-acetylglucosamine 1-carboxyvinyltransferase [Candidatus Hydrogenosomobacter endosymbioticus]
MDKMLIVGGVPLRGTIPINGAKNAALPLMALGLLSDQPLVLDNVPTLADLTTMELLLSEIGSVIKRVGKKVAIYTPSIKSFEAPYDIVRKMRASILVLGPLLARCGRAHVSLPGGCAIGARPVNFHIDGLRALGATIEIENGYICANVPGGKLTGAEYTFPNISVTGAENMILAASLARGETCLKNVAIEPEIGDLLDCLQAMGVQVEGKGTPTVRIQGTESLSGAFHKVMPDRIEAGTYIAAAIITCGEVELENINISLLPTFVDALRNAGATIEPLENDKIYVSMSGKIGPLSIETSPFPGLATDLQAQLMALLSVSSGESVIVENIFENRFMHVCELARMGAQISVSGNRAHVTGVEHLSGTSVMATDLRASTSLVIAGLAARGETIVSRLYHIDRGYESIEKKLSECGAIIKRVREGEAHTASGTNKKIAG